MSWSSSLLFVIQYAQWRSHVLGIPPARIQMTIVDTSKFPHRQFARDLWLLDRYRSTSTDIRNLLRVREGGVDNGEYLSQGILNHKDRSYVFSLGNLIDADLYGLYPELQDRHKSWTNRVQDLRESWMSKQRTTLEEVQAAMQVGEQCCPTSPSDMAILPLSFKERKMGEGQLC